MQIKNCEDISNGDIGYITSVTRDDTDSVLTVDFGDGRIAEYDGSDLEMLDLPTPPPSQVPGQRI